MSGKPAWKKPFNDTYINLTRDGLPVSTKISDIVERIMIQAEKAILANGGKKVIQNNSVFYLIKPDV
jgi:hypothetical protein